MTTLSVWRVAVAGGVPTGTQERREVHAGPFSQNAIEAEAPGADVPFGMVQWSPDTPSSPSGGGYEYDDSSITGFSLAHLSGPGWGRG